MNCCITVDCIIDTPSVYWRKSQKWSTKRFASRLRKNGYVEGNDIQNLKKNHKPIRMTLYTITPRGRKLLK